MTMPLTRRCTLSKIKLREARLQLLEAQKVVRGDSLNLVGTLLGAL
jgi:hypothetical protein